MTLVQSWIDSLTLLKPKNFQLFVVEMLTSLRETYKLMFKYFWWILVLMAGCYAVSVWLTAKSDIGYYATFGYRWLYHLLSFVICLAARPSIVQKNCAYFRSHIYAFIYVLILVVSILNFFWLIARSPWYIFLILFFLDSEEGPKNFFLSMWYALKMIIFNFPLLAIISICFYLPVSLLFKYVNRAIIFFVFEENVMAQLFIVVGLIRHTIAILLLPIVVCTYANIYIKKLNDQSDLYPKPVQQ